MQNDRIIHISTGRSRTSKEWQRTEYLWSEFVERLRTPARTDETVEQYHTLSKREQGRLKDVGGFVGGTLKGLQRKAANVESRDLITLDMDAIAPGETQSVIRRIAGLGIAYAVYSTRSHTEHRPRLRAIFPTDRSITADEYEPIARKIASLIGIDLCDPTTFEASRLMFWPSCSKDAIYVFCFEDKPFLSADGILSTYEDWHDVRTWPQVPGATGAKERLALSKQSDPTKKTGIVGAFCRVYDILGAIEAFIPHAYEPTDSSDRLTFATGSTVAGAVLYDDNKFLYSHHATDPCSGLLVNAFDLIRLHKFADLDETAKEGTPNNRLPSFLAMQKEALADAAVATELQTERAAQAADVFGMTEPPEHTGTGTGAEPPAVNVNWMRTAVIQFSDTGKPKKTMDNIVRILNSDPLLKGKIAYDAFSVRVLALGALPWNAATDRRLWTDSDDAGVQWYLEYRFDITGKDKILSALILVAERNSFNDVVEYLRSVTWDGKERLDDLFRDYLGAPDTPYTRTVCRKAFVAAVARAMTPGCKYDYVPVLVGRQSLGKSTFLQTMAKSWFSDSFSTFDGKDAVESIQGRWIIELAEMTGYSKSAENIIKQFLSRTSDFFRMPFGRRAAEYPRKCVFFGSCNETEFLRDLTGNRRFWPVDVGIKPAEKSIWKDLPHEVDQIWAEAVHRWRAGEFLYLTPEMEAVAKEMQDGHRESNIREGLIKAFLQKPVPRNYQTMALRERQIFWSGVLEDKGELVPRDRICALEVWCECLDGDPKLMKRSDAKEINLILEHLPGTVRTGKAARFGYCGVQRGFLITNEKDV